jgi:hypothetical protein
MIFSTLSNAERRAWNLSAAVLFGGGLPGNSEMPETDVVERALLGPGLGSCAMKEWFSLEHSDSPGWGGEGEVPSGVLALFCDLSLPSLLAARDDLKRLGIGAPETSNAVAFKKNSDSSRGDVKVVGLVGRTDVSTILTFSFERALLGFRGDDSGVLKERERGEDILTGTVVYVSGIPDGDPGTFQGEDSFTGGGGSLMPLAGFCSRCFPLTNLDLDLILLDSPVLASPSPSAGSIGLTGEMTTEVSSCSSSLHISPNLDAWAKVDIVEVREAATRVGDLVAVPVDINGSSGIFDATRVDVVDMRVTERDWDGVEREESGSEDQAKDFSEPAAFVFSWITKGRDVRNLDEGILPSIPLPTEYEEYGAPCLVCLLGLPCTSPVGPSLSAPIPSQTRSTGTYAGPGSSGVTACFATHRWYELNDVNPTSAPRTIPATTNTGAREKGFKFSLVRIRGRGALVVDGGRAVISTIEGDGEGVCDDRDGRAVDVGIWDELSDAKKGWGARVFQKSS